MEPNAVPNLGTSEFDKEVLQSDVPALVDFYADWCPPCRLVSPVIEALSREYEGKMKFVKVDTDANQDLARRYGVMSIPTVIIFTSGEVKEKLVGAAHEASYRKIIDSVLKS